jgi:hypothetical protein
VNDSTVVSGVAAVCTSSSEAGQKLDADTPIETTEQLRIAIDQGRGGHKIDVNGPAAAPLGTDAEAGGLQLIRVICGLYLESPLLRRDRPVGGIGAPSR